VDEYRVLNTNSSDNSLGYRKNIYYVKRNNGKWSEPSSITSYLFEQNKSMSTLGFREISEVKIAIDQYNHPHVIYKTGTALQFPKYDDNIFITSYNGVNWSQPENISFNDSVRCKNPQIAFDEFNNAHVVWIEQIDGKYNLMHKQKKEDRWGEKQILQSNIYSEVSMMGNANGLHMVFSKKMEFGSKLFYSKYSENSWSTSTVIDSVKNTSENYFMDSYFTEISGNNTDLGVVYLLSSFRNGVYDFEQLAVSKSHNGIWTKEPNIVVGQGAVCPCARVGEIKYDSNNTAHLFWQEYNDGPSRIYYSKEINHSFGNKTQISSDSEGTLDYRLASCLKNDTAFVFYNAYNKGNYEIFYNYADLKCKQSNTRIKRKICQHSVLEYNNHFYSKDGIYLDTLINMNGCDSIIETTLTVAPIIEDTITTLLCPNEKIYFSNQNINKEGIYKDTLTSSNGCDSIITLIVGRQTDFFEKKYYSICAGEEIDGFNKTGVYITQDTLPGGCISKKELHVIVNPVYNDTVFYSINQGENYCGYDKTGVYSMYMKTNLGCDSIITVYLKIDTISNIIDNRTFNNSYILYPNPAKNKIWIKLNYSLTKKLRIEIINQIGVISSPRIIRNEKNDIEVDLSSYAVGLYIVRILNDSEIINIKVLKN
jgi:hypothetical protein